MSKLKLRNTCRVCLAAVVGLGTLLTSSVRTAEARDLKYTGDEVSIYLTPGEPTQIVFPGKIEGGFKRKNSAIGLQRNDNYLILFAQPDLTDDGEALLVLLDDKRSYAIRALPSSEERKRDESVKLIDEREDTDVENGPATPELVPRQGFAPPSLPTGLMREMILAAEFGTKRGIRGYKQSNRYSGETVLHDGSLEAKIQEMYMGPDLWGYVLSVENLLDTTQRLNPASFRLDGTKAVTAQRWELAPRPKTAEQKLAGEHKAKVYIVTRALKH